MLPGRGFGLGGFLTATEHPEHAARRTEFHDHVRALVDGPDVVVLVDADAVRERPGVKPLADLADKLAFLVELQKLRRRRSIGRAARALRAREDEDMALRVH